MHKVTIGIPLYNAEAYITQTIHSALNQTFDSIEFLIVDDKSTDRSPAIIHELIHTHPRGKNIRLISHQINQGVSIARNTIIQACQTPYLFFLDSDDLITTDCIEKLYYAAEKNQSEVTYGSYIEKWEDNQRASQTFVLPNLEITKEDDFGNFANSNLRQNIQTFVWNILYDISFLRRIGVLFQPVTIWEDLLFYNDFFPFVKQASLLSDVTYIYNKRGGSLSQYNSRNTIPLQEINQHFYIVSRCKEGCLSLIEKKYFSNLMTKTMRFALDTAAVAVDKHKLFVPPLKKKEIKKVLKHPLRFSQITSLKSYKSLNLMLYFIQKLPSWFLFITLNIYMKLLKAYRKRKK